MRETLGATMTVLVFGLLIFLIGGIAGRVRGQAEPWNNTFSRYVIWGVPVGINVLVFTLNPLYAVLSSVSR